jgi:hypothetical protein
MCSHHQHTDHLSLRSALSEFATGERVEGSMRDALPHETSRIMNATMLSRSNGTSQRELNGWREPSWANSIRRGSEVSLLLPTSMLSESRGEIRGGSQDRCSSHRYQDPSTSLMEAITTGCRTSAGVSGLLLPDAPALYGCCQGEDTKSVQDGVWR